MRDPDAGARAHHRLERRDETARRTLDANALLGFDMNVRFAIGNRDDVVAAIVAALRQGQPGRIYNVVDNEPVTQLDFFTWLSTRLGRGLPPFAPDAPNGTGKRGTTNKRVSNLRLKAELGCVLNYPTFREGFEDDVRRLE